METTETTTQFVRAFEPLRVFTGFNQAGEKTFETHINRPATASLADFIKTPKAVVTVHDASVKVVKRKPPVDKFRRSRPKKAYVSPENRDWKPADEVFCRLIRPVTDLQKKYFREDGLNTRYRVISTRGNRLRIEFRNGVFGEVDQDQIALV